MTKVIIDQLEVVKVDQQHVHGVGPGVSAADRPAHRFGEEPAVWQLGEQIVGRRIPQLRLGLPDAARDVSHQHSCGRRT